VFALLVREFYFDTPRHVPRFFSLRFVVAGIITGSPMSDQPPKPIGWDEATPHMQLAWRKENTTNPTGFVGVTKTRGGFRANIRNPITEERYDLGPFDTAEEAGDAFDAAFLEIHGEEKDDLDWVDQWDDQPGPLSPEFRAQCDRELAPILEMLRADDDEEKAQAEAKLQQARNKDKP